MLDFEPSMTEVPHKRKISKAEDVRAIRLAVAATYEASQAYMQLAASLNNKSIEKVLRSVADEERVHMGVFLKLLEQIAPGEKKLLLKRANQVEKGSGKMK